MNKSRTGLALIGYGGMGSWHADKTKLIEEIHLCGVYDIDPKRCALAQENGFSVYPSREALLADPAVQAVTIATPNDTHLPIALAAVEAGKNVICEKPVALSSGELKQMMAKAEEKNVLFTVHQNRRWDEDFLVVKRLYDEGTLGPVFNIESRVHGSRGIPGDWRNTKEHGGGMVLDWGVHMLDQIMQMLSDRKLETVWAQLSHVTNEAVDDGFRAILGFSGGLSCLVEVGTSNFISLPRWYVQGENGSAIVKDWDLSGEVVMVSDWEKRDAVPVVTAAGLTKTMAPRTEETIKRYPLPAVKADICDYYRNIAAAVQGEAELIVRPAQALLVMRVMEAIFASAEKGEAIQF